MRNPNKPHEVRDAIHTFVHFETNERSVIDSIPFQRLRYIHQLAMTYLVYPGATHSRFEHSLGVMELASKIFDVITAEANIHPILHPLLPKSDFPHWRRVLRMAALCHDLGHLPFSHAGEEELLPPDVAHEDLTLSIIRSNDMKNLWKQLHIDSEEVGKLAVGAQHYDEPLDDWEALLSEIIVGDALGADRMDYLLRDSYHAGVSYGRFEHHRLIETMRVLPSNEGEDVVPALGIEQGGPAVSGVVGVGAVLHVYSTLLPSSSSHIRHSLDAVLKSMAPRRPIQHKVP